MIVPMKKVSLIVLGDNKEESLKKLRKLGLMHIEINEGTSERITELKGQITMLENSIFSIEEKEKKSKEFKEATTAEALQIARTVTELAEEKKAYQAEQIALNTELDRLSSWGDVEPEQFAYLASNGIEVSLYEIPKAEYETLGDNVKTISLGTTKTSVKCLVIGSGTDEEAEVMESLKNYRLELPKLSTSEMKQKLENLKDRKSVV